MSSGPVVTLPACLYMTLYSKACTRGLSSKVSKAKHDKDLIFPCTPLKLAVKHTQTVPLSVREMHPVCPPVRREMSIPSVEHPRKHLAWT